MPEVLQPHAQVGQQVAQHLHLIVIIKLGVPQPVVAPVSLAEVAGFLRLAPVKACSQKSALA